MRYGYVQVRASQVRTSQVWGRSGERQVRLGKAHTGKNVDAVPGCLRDLLHN